MSTTTVMSLTPKPFTTSSTQFPSTAQRCRLRSLAIVPIKSSSDSSNDAGNASPPITPPDAVEIQIRFRRGSRRKSRQQQQEDGVGGGGAPKKAEQKKEWESMSMTEKAIELYMGEKGLLFWINKLAYACIFVVIGAWILFRFVGPALNLYQLDSAPLPPTSIFKS